MPGWPHLRTLEKTRPLSCSDAKAAAMPTRSYACGLTELAAKLKRGRQESKKKIPPGPVSGPRVPNERTSGRPDVDNAVMEGTSAGNPHQSLYGDTIS